LRRSPFISFGARFDVRQSVVEGILDELCSRAPAWIDRVEEIGLGRASRVISATR